ncbi:MAG: sulfatase [Planctomycetota bacterium]|jgi:arylsulfatase A-like enzyme
MNRRQFLKLLSVTTASLNTSGCWTDLKKRTLKTPEKPNIIIILADDLGYGDVGCYGNKTIKTPNIDALAKGGLKFTDFHTNAPMCSPTRASLLTGLYPQRCGIGNALGRNPNDGLRLEKITFAEVLKKVGYRTAIFGKWHLGVNTKFNPIHQGFDEFRGYVTGDGDYHSHIDRWGDPDWWEGGKLKPDEGYATSLITNYSVDFIKRNKNNPFCLYIAHEAVHFPYQGPEDKADRYAGREWFDLKYGSRKDRKVAYKEMIESMDTGVGKIMQTLKKLGIEQKTFVFFASDNGGHHLVASNNPLKGYKFDLWEGGHRVPAVAYWPGIIKPNTVTHQTAMTFDLFPTMVDIVGIKQDHKIDGISLLPLILRGSKLSERTLFWELKHFDKVKAVRQGHWKLMVIKKKNNPSLIYELYNLDKDIGEKNNLADKFPDKVKELEALYNAWLKEVSAKT